MPKKTKKEKIIAEYRRKLSTIRASVPAAPARFMADHTAPLLVSQAATSVQSVNRAIRRDLVRTILLATIAIAGEVALSLVVR